MGCGAFLAVALILRGPDQHCNLLTVDEPMKRDHANIVQRCDLFNRIPSAHKTQGCTPTHNYTQTE